MTRTIAVISSSRADFSHLQWPLRKMQARSDLQTRLIVTGAHLSPEFGLSRDDIEAAGLKIDYTTECLLSSDSDTGMAKSIGIATMSLTDLLSRLRPDLLLLIADRYEMLAPAAAALALRIPMAHIEGGEISEGAIDHAVRNALTQMAHLHFTPTDAARQRVIAMGEESWRVHTVGAPSIDTLLHSQLLNREELQNALQVTLPDSFLLAALHPVTLLDNTLAEADAFFAALEHQPRPVLFCYPNADAGSRRLIGRAREFCASRSGCHVFVNLAPELYWSLLRLARALVGNSSSGIMETPALKLPTVNVGIRQLGRQRADNIIDADAQKDTISAAIDQAASDEFRHAIATMRNPYGDGQAGERIAQLLATAPGREKLLLKRALPVEQHADGQFSFRQ